jgi:hypothetical protein
MDPTLIILVVVAAVLPVVVAALTVRRADGVGLNACESTARHGGGRPAGHATDRRTGHPDHRRSGAATRLVGPSCGRPPRLSTAYSQPPTGSPVEGWPESEGHVGLAQVLTCPRCGEQHGDLVDGDARVGPAGWITTARILGAERRQSAPTRPGASSTAVTRSDPRWGARVMVVPSPAPWDRQCPVDSRTRSGASGASASSHEVRRKCQRSPTR